MSSTLRSVAKHTRTLSRNVAPKPAARSFHSPFVVLPSSFNSAPQQPTTQGTPLYEKSADAHGFASLAPGQRHYVVSEPDPRSTPYEVPYGAYPTSEPYQNYAATDAPITTPHSSTSPDLAHPFTTHAATQNPTGANDAAGIQESASVRFRSAPGLMAAGGDGGLGLMDKATTKPGEGELATRNPPPDAPATAEKNSRLGVDGAWKTRRAT
ncbi:hypothetical protein BDY19DRAFT_938763 [Irpex rosettiformis]|uniref:Uncharacterized protein n=1 Tax=Irpex rosettiformis TaxID=378272 RepID=A0ACB8U7A7_9APHY|nr:hypothetical protein BDY19DRAFT_938763 [Irpex rosettiformis]